MRQTKKTALFLLLAALLAAAILARGAFCQPGTGGSCKKIFWSWRQRGAWRLP